MNLKKVYEERVSGVVYKTISDLEKLFDTNDRQLLFVLMYFYLMRVDLSSYDILSSVKIRYSIYALCKSSGCTDSVREYYNQYIDINEVSDQIDSLVEEFKYCV